MTAYAAAQFVDAYVLHFRKQLTIGRRIRLRANGSTVVSLAVDTTAVILITLFYANALPVDDPRGVSGQLLNVIATAYAFKPGAGLLNTAPCYLGAAWLQRYLRPPRATGGRSA